MTLQQELHEWRLRNFPDADPTQQLLGVGEEVGELMHAHLKSMQGIRGDDKLHEAEAKDAVGDIVIFLMGYCSYHGWDLMQLVYDAAETVFARDWIADPVAGGTDAQGH